ncbi:hypothetical protein PybrP1_006451 [[Pythium] brassicae (nom. inval.)]|nr:hypothetical protein PybrP1_006451 [[Pythium] brassicae (nom. inval.)]
MSARTIRQATALSGSSSLNAVKRRTEAASAAAGAIGALKPRSLLPHREAASNTPTLRFLKWIDRVEIASVESFRGVTYYVIDVYLKAAHEASDAAATSRIPTTRLRKPVLLSAVCSAAPSSERGDSNAECASCRRFRSFLLCGFTHPRAFVKLCANVSLRKKLLARFLRRAIELAVDTGDSCNQRANDGVECSRCRVLPRLVDRFIRLDMSP